VSETTSRTGSRTSSERRPTNRVRLLKVIVQPVYVVDDGEALKELAAQLIEIKSGAWDDFAASAFTPELLARIAEQLGCLARH
jgi:hypothetical protein